MRTLMARMAVTFCAAVSLTAPLGTASAAPSTAPMAAHAVTRQAGRPVIVDCSFNPRERPHDFILACGDGNSRLASLHWSQWGSRSATARGFNFVNDCKPYCAAGRFHSYPVIVRLDEPRPWAKDPQFQRFTRISLLYPADRPEGYEPVMTFPL
ncbi:hypothetical protein [Streptomyces sp. NPDC046197]|uniref:hypothetical protein n=1 Tax=Streptomyces sp. NPDC046197 TaxID=3154337 RepID=UPI0033F8B071